MVSKPRFVEQRGTDRRCDPQSYDRRPPIGGPVDSLLPLARENNVVIPLRGPASVDAVLFKVVVDLDIELFAVRVGVISNQRFVVKSRIPDFKRPQPTIG